MHKHQYHKQKKPRGSMMTDEKPLKTSVLVSDLMSIHILMHNQVICGDTLSANLILLSPYRLSSSQEAPGILELAYFNVLVTVTSTAIV